MKKRFLPAVVLILGSLLMSVSSPAQEPYSVKGFTIGESSLADFKAQLHHCADSCKTSPTYAPFCSDSSPAGGLTPDGKDATSWTAVGLVFCDPYFPFENSHGVFFTLAEINTTARFDFIDGKLYRVSAAFPNTGGVNFRAMRDALTSKYGNPSQERLTNYQNSFGATRTGSIVSWDNGITTIELTEYNANVDESAVVFTHKKLAADALARAPKKTGKDL